MTFEYRPIGEFFRFKKGLGYQGKYLEPSPVALIGLNSFEGGGGYKYGGEKAYSGPFKPDHVAHVGDLFISTTDITQDGRVLASPFILPNLTESFSEVIYSGDIAKAIQTEEGLSKEFLFNVLRIKSFRQKAAYASTGTTVRRIPLEVLELLEVPVPPISVQESINEVIAIFDKKIESNKALSRTLEDIAELVFKSWFINFDPVTSKNLGKSITAIEPELFNLFPREFQESALGETPLGWEVSELFDCQLVIESGSRPKGGVKGIKEGIPSIGAESINGIGVFEFGKTKFVPEDFFNKLKRGKPKDFDVLLYKDGGKPGEFKPRVGMYGLDFPFAEYALNEHVYLLRSAELGQPFLYFWINLERTLDVLRSRGIKAAIPGINQQDVGTLKVLRPPRKLLDKFNEMCLPIIEAILRLSAEAREIRKIRDELLPRLVSGQLKIDDAKAQI